MKFIYLFLTIVMSNYAFTQQNTLSPQVEEYHHDIFLSKDKKIDEESHPFLIYYTEVITIEFGGQLQPIGWGHGALLRFHEPSKPFGLQLNGSVRILEFPFGSGYNYQGSTSAIYYPFYYMGTDSIMSRLNLTFGAGVNADEGQTYFVLPLLSIGYQGKKFFFDIGILNNGIPYDYTQIVKLGMRF